MNYVPNKRIKLFKKNAEYIPGEGLEVEYQVIESTVIPETDETEALVTSVFFCEWKGGFGQTLMAARAMGVAEMATLRMNYNPAIDEAIKTAEVLCVLDADDTAFIDGQPNINCPNLFSVWGSSDNAKLDNIMMEFNVRRYESK